MLHTCALLGGRGFYFSEGGSVFYFSLANLKTIQSKIFLNSKIPAVQIIMKIKRPMQSVWSALMIKRMYRQ